MSAPLLTLTWSDGDTDVRVYYDADRDVWSSDYENDVISEAYIVLMQAATDPSMNPGGMYEPFPFIARLIELSTTLNYTLSGVDELVAHLYKGADPNAVY